MGSNPIPTTNYKFKTMETNEIKKALYKQKPIAKKISEEDGNYVYKTRLNDGTGLDFIVPIKDMGDANFEEEMEAKYLIRWLTGVSLT